MLITIKFLEFKFFFIFLEYFKFLHLNQSQFFTESFIFFILSFFEMYLIKFFGMSYLISFFIAPFFVSHNLIKLSQIIISYQALPFSYLNMFLRIMTFI
jgi:hypothetical protein